MLIQRLHLKKLLSFNDCEVELGALNVLIGPNAVGKSNLIEAIGLLQAAPTSLSAAILRGGGIRQWLWLGDPVPSPIATLECQLQLPSQGHVGSNGHRANQLVYCLEFSEAAFGLVILNERWEDAGTDLEGGRLRLERDQVSLLFPGTYHRELAPRESLLSQYKNPADPTPITEMGIQLSRVRIFREFRTGPQSGARHGASTSVSKDALMDGGDNLALVLQELDFLGQHPRIQHYLGRFCDRFEDVKVNIGEGLARLYLRESGLSEMLSAIRMSDGTLKFLSLLAALFHPNQPSLMCIEEPEVGLHPDALQLVAEALVEASKSIQLIVTTHSDALVDALTDQPQSVLVCERDFDNGTQMKRLSKAALKDWLQHYTLGQLWRNGEIGGGRW